MYVCYYGSGDIAFVTSSDDILEVFMMDNPGGAYEVVYVRE